MSGNMNNVDKYNYLDDDWNTYPDDRTKRYMRKIKDGIENYSNGRHRYKDGGSNERMVEGIEMTMCAIVDFIEALMDLAETSQEKEIVRKNIDKIKRI